MNSTRLIEENRSLNETSIMNSQKTQIFNKNELLLSNTDDILSQIFKESLSNYPSGMILKKRITWNSKEYFLGVEVRDIEVI